MSKNPRQVACFREELEEALKKSRVPASASHDFLEAAVKNFLRLSENVSLPKRFFALNDTAVEIARRNNIEASAVFSNPAAYVSSFFSICLTGQEPQAPSLVKPFVPPLLPPPPPPPPAPVPAEPLIEDIPQKKRGPPKGLKLSERSVPPTLEAIIESGRATVEATDKRPLTGTLVEYGSLSDGRRNWTTVNTQLALQAGALKGCGFRSLKEVFDAHNIVDKPFTLTKAANEAFGATSAGTPAERLLHDVAVVVQRLGSVPTVYRHKDAVISDGRTLIDLNMGGAFPPEGWERVMRPPASRNFQEFVLATGVARRWRNHILPAAPEMLTAIIQKLG